MNAFIKVASFQGRMKEKDVQFNVTKIKNTLEWCEENNVDILCMPECFF